MRNEHVYDVELCSRVRVCIFNAPSRTVSAEMPSCNGAHSHYPYHRSACRLCKDNVKAESDDERKLLSCKSFLARRLSDLPLRWLLQQAMPERAKICKSRHHGLCSCATLWGPTVMSRSP